MNGSETKRKNVRKIVDFIVDGPTKVRMDVTKSMEKNVFTFKVLVTGYIGGKSYGQSLFTVPLRASQVDVDRYDFNNSTRRLGHHGLPYTEPKHTTHCLCVRNVLETF